MKSFLVLLFAIATFHLVGWGQTALDSLFSVRGGIYLKAQTIAIDTKAGYTVYYTTDGSKPTSGSNAYKSPISISKPTVIRAVFYKGGIPTGIATQSYIIGREFKMAVISIAVQPEDFFSYDRGIYVKGCCADSAQPYHGANFWRGWERAINIEMYEPDNTLAFNQGAGTRIFGGFSKGLPMKSLSILAKSKYGPKKFKYQIFPNKDIKKFNSFVLRSSGGDFNNTHFRDALLTDLTEPLDMDIQAYRPCVLYINGEYWGIHNIREKLNEHYLEENHGVNKDSVDLLKHRGDVQEGNKKAYNQLMSFLGSNSFETNQKIQELDKMMDIDNYINYNITEIYVDNGDAGGNIRYWREQKEGARWRWILFDLDLSFGIGDRFAYKQNTLLQMTRATNEIWPNPAWATFIVRKLLENDSVQKVYVNRFADHLNSIFSPENVVFKIDSIQNLIIDEMPFHFQKWPATMDKWKERVEYMRVYAQKRPFYMRAYLMEKFNLADTVMVNILPFDNSMGHIKLNSLKLKEEFHGWYFEGCPITVKAKPKVGYEFVKWEGIDSKEMELTLNLTSAVTLKPIFKKKAASVLSGIIKFNEISIKQDSINKSGDWLEIYNISTNQVDLSGWLITTAEKEKFVFPEGTTIGANSFLVVCKNVEDFQNIYQLSNDLVIQKGMEFGFKSKKDFIQLFDLEEQIVDSLHYNIKKDYNELVDIESKNLERVNPKQPKWQVSKVVTPGFQNKGYKGIPEVKKNNLDNLQWWIIGGLGGLLLVVLAIIGLVKKKRLRKQPESPISPAE